MEDRRMEHVLDIQFACNSKSNIYLAEIISTQLNITHLTEFFNLLEQNWTAHFAAKCFKNSLKKYNHIERSMDGYAHIHSST